MRAVRDGLDNLEVVKPWTDTEETKAVKTELCKRDIEDDFEKLLLARTRIWSANSRTCPWC